MPIRDLINPHMWTRAVHAGRDAEATTGAVVPPIHPTTTFERDGDGGYPRGFAYSTFANPNRAGLEAAITQLEGGAGAVASASGMAAIAGVLGALDAGDRVVVAYDLFQGTARLLNDQGRRWGIEIDVVDVCDLTQVSAAISPRTRMIWVDTPSNPLMRVADIAALAELARAKNCYLAIDSTFATFALQRPLLLGADVVVHAATKFIGGHSDVVSGLAVFREAGELYDRARAFQINVGAVPSPFDCWLVHRGLRTLPLRINAQSKSALAVATALERHPMIEQVFYPGLTSNPTHAVAAAQMRGGYGGVLSAAVRGGREPAVATVASVRLFFRAASFGGVESLIEHRASSPIQTRGQGTGYIMPEGLLRLSIGLEAPDDLIADLEQALSAAARICGGSGGL